MYRFGVLVGSALVAVTALVTPVAAAGRGPQPAASSVTSGTPSRNQKQVNWQERDTATYVVSTLNVVRTDNGRSFRRAAAQSLHIARYDVLADTLASGLYFIELRRDDGTLAAALAYQMGWPKPRGVTTGLDDLGITSAPQKVADAYRTDPKKKIGSFKSTMPG